MKGDLPMNVRKIITAKMAKSYKKATKKEKGKILDSLQELTGFNRTYLARRLRTFSFKKVERDKKMVRRCKYTEKDEKALVEIWELMNYACGKRLKAAMGEVISNLERHGHWRYGEEVKAHLLEMSSSTMDRRLRKYKFSLKKRRGGDNKAWDVIEESDTGSLVS